MPGMKENGFNLWVRKIPWSRNLQPTPVFFPGKFHGQRSLAGYSPWGHEESNTTEQLNALMFLIILLSGSIKICTILSMFIIPQKTVLWKNETKEF